MNVTWLIQTNLVDSGQQLDVWRYAKDVGARVKEVVVMPFESSIQLPEPLNPFEDGVTIPYGSTALIERLYALNAINESFHAFKGLCYDPKTANVMTWLKERDDMLNQDAVLTTVDKLKDLYPDQNPEAFYFIRPAGDLKAFKGSCVPLREIRQWQTSRESHSSQITGDLRVVVSSAKDIYGEYRYFIIGGKIVSGSRYYPGGRKKPERVTDHARLVDAQTMADGWLPHENCVMDLADTDQGSKVIEFNTINCAGFYHHDVRAIVHALTAYYRTRSSTTLTQQQGN